jgi:cytochrome c oxidase subunit 2
MHIHPLEKRYVFVVGAIVATMLLLILGSFVLLNIYPPSNAGETIDSTRLHLTAEFAEQNLGVQNNPDGSVVVRMVMGKFHVTPDEIVVPADTPLVFRIATPDVVHGLNVPGTNINTMVVPGYVAQVRTQIQMREVKRHGQANPDGSVVVPLFCNEYCGYGHQSMWGRIVVRPVS